MSHNLYYLFVIAPNPACVMNESGLLIAESYLCRIARRVGISESMLT